jgi:3,4-dihydroxy-2-butanone 4-phosphate synthase
VALRSVFTEAVEGNGQLSHRTFATTVRTIRVRIAYSSALILCSISNARAQQLSIPPALNDSATKAEERGATGMLGTY